MAVAGVILAGGRSVRMGSPKALLDFRGAPFVVRILEVLEALDVRPRVVVVSPLGADIRAAVSARACTIVENPDIDGGPIASLGAALRVLRPLRVTGALVWPVDLPHVRVTTVAQLLDAHRRERALATVPTYGGRRGHPVVWDESAWDDLLTHPAAPRGGARAVIQDRLAEVRTVAVDDAAVIDTLNSPPDYERLIGDADRAP